MSAVTAWLPISQADQMQRLYARDATGLEALTWHDGDEWVRPCKHVDGYGGEYEGDCWWWPTEFLPNEPKQADPWMNWPLGSPNGEQFPTLRSLEFPAFRAGAEPGHEALGEVATAPERCAGCDIPNGCREYCRCSPAEPRALAVDA
jgi:hypothetical protein